MADAREGKEMGLLEVLEEKLRDKKAKEKRERFFSFIRGEAKPNPLIKMVRGEGK